MQVLINVHFLFPAGTGAAGFPAKASKASRKDSHIFRANRSKPGACFFRPTGKVPEILNHFFLFQADSR